MFTSLWKSYRFAAGAMVLGLVLAGCSTDVQLINRAHEARDNGVALYHQARYAEAAGAFKNAIRQDSREYKAYYFMGCSYESLQQYEQALQAYKAGLDVMHRSLAGQEDHAFRMRVIHTLAGLIARIDERGVEKAELEKSAKARGTGEYYLVLANTYRASGDADSAVDAYNTGYLLDQTDFDLARDYGLYMVQVGQTQKAAAPLQTANKLDPRDQQIAAALRQIGIVPGTVPPAPKDVISPTLSNESGNDIAPVQSAPAGKAGAGAAAEGPKD